MGKVSEVDPFATSEMDLPARKLGEESPGSCDLCHTLSKALEMSRAGTKDSP